MNTIANEHKSHAQDIEQDELNKTVSKRISFATKLSASIGVLIIVIMIILGLVVTNNQATILKNQTIEFGRTLINQLSESSKEPVLAGDSFALEVLVTNLAEESNVLGTVVFSEQGSILSQVGVTPADHRLFDEKQWRNLLSSNPSIYEWKWKPVAKPEINVLTFTGTIEYNGLVAGYTLITLSRETMDQAVHRTVLNIIFATIALIAIFTPFIYIIGKRISSPINHLRDLGMALNEGSFHKRIDQERDDEIGDLYQTFNNMADVLQKKSNVEDAFCRYVSNNVAQQIIDDPTAIRLGGEHVHASIVFADVVGFTALTETYPAEKIVEMLNEYFSYITYACEQYHGSIDKYVGDCAMLTFGIPKSEPQHAFNAVACSVFIQKIIHQLNLRRQAANKLVAPIRVSVNSGEMLAGNMGSTTQMQYTVVGRPVNLAARLCGVAAPGSVVITQRMYHTYELKNSVIVDPFETVALKGVNYAVKTFLVTDVAEAHQKVQENSLANLFPNYRRKKLPV